jgi:DegV family protein with EDD domain
MAADEKQPVGQAGRLDRSNTVLVVDSTADLPTNLAQDENVFMVPLNVHFGEDVYRDWVDIRPPEFYARLRAASQPPRTSQPSAGAFISAYTELRERFERIYSLHLSAKLSGTLASASLAEQEVEGVTLIDTELASVGISLLVDRLLVLLERGTTEQELEAYVERYRTERGFLFLVATLEYLQKGGRIGRASSLAGSLLNVRPLLTFTEGEVDAYKKVRGERKALGAVRDYFLERTRPGSPVYMSIGHADAPDKGEELAALLRETDREIDLRFMAEIGPVIGTYGGPGTIGLFFIQE